MKSSMIVVGALAVASGIGPVVLTRPASHIRSVSVQRILVESTAAKEAAKRLEAFRSGKAQEVAAKQKSLDATRLALANAGGILQRSRRAQLKAQESREQAELQQTQQRAQTEFQEMQRQFQTDLRRQLGGVINEMAKRNAIEIVLNQDAAVVWAIDKIDFTTEVIERLNAAAIASPKAK